MAYTEIPSGSTSSGGGPTWLSTARSQVTTLSGGALTGASEWYSDLADTSDVAAAGTGGGLTFSATLDGGVGTIATGGAGTVQRAFPAGKPSLISSATTKKIYGLWRARFIGPAGAQGVSQVGIADPAFTNIVVFGIKGNGFAGGSNTNFVVETTAAATATSTVIDSASYHTVEFYSDGTTGTFYYDGTAINITASMAAFGANAATVHFLVFTNDATVRSCAVDRMYAAYIGQ